MTEISNYAKYRVTGPGAEAWLSSLLTARMPQPGRITLTAMLNEAGPDRRRVHGRASRPTADEFYLFGSLPAEVHHSRWFRHHLPADGSVRFEVLGLGLVGLSVAGPRSRDVLQAIAPDLDLSTAAFPFMTFRQVDLGMTPVAPGPDQLRRRPRLRAVGRAGVPARAVRPDRGRRRAARPAAVRDAGADVAPAREELRDVVPRVPADLHAARGRASPATSSSTTSSSGGRRTRPRSRPAARSGGSSRSSSTPTRTTRPTSSATSRCGTTARSSAGSRRAGTAITSRQSIALGYVPAELATPDGPGGDGFEIEIIGRRRPARLQPEPLFDPTGARMRP